MGYIFRRIAAITSLEKSIFLFIILLAGCSLEKKSFVNRNLQNLTAHYNILFNAGQLLIKKQSDYELAFVDNYNNILSVYQDTITRTNSTDKDLDAVVVKANTIINIKEQSHYIADAYLVLGQANFLSGNYYNATEYFNYVIRLFPERTELCQEARVWKARCLMYLNQLPAVKPLLDTTIQNIDPKKHLAVTADIYATKLQYDINAEDYADGEAMAKLAVTNSGIRRQRLRWSFILAQVQEMNNHTADAYRNYTSIVNSNASFEMAFNADLNRIRIEEVKNGQNVSRVDRLKILLKNQNNKEFTDQIYYQMAEYYMTKNDVNNAIKNYKLAIRYSQKNQTQKGLAYLKIADINFKIKADYVTAKKYYDSTLTNLPPNYPGYANIQKKSSNLQLLADRLKVIANEDTLQMLAKLDEKARLKRIDQLVDEEVLRQQTIADNNAAIATSAASSAIQSGKSNFYFYNTGAVSQGFTDFKRKWGARKLEDNWRRSSRQSSDITANTTVANANTDPDATTAPQKKAVLTGAASNYRQGLIQALPLTPLRLQQSNDRIYNAYLDIAGFYRDILGDKKEAITNYEALLKLYPTNPNTPAVYYSLYRLYSDIDPAMAANYKNRLLKEFPETNFAKVILDPDYAKKLNDKDAGFNTLYNQVYELYAKHNYPKTISNADSLLKQYPDNKFAAQLAYLRAMAAGHNETLVPFEQELQGIINKYTNDRLIVPLVMQHLAYANANQAELAARPVVLVNDSLENPLAPLRKQQVLRSSETFKELHIKAAPPEPAKKQAQQASVTPAKPAVARPKVISKVFSMRDSTHYYFVINVSSGTTNLASSRFGFGQYNRANYPPNAIKHYEVDVGADNQLIYIGHFFNIKAVKDYARAIIPLLPEIMKVPADKYTFFIITKENLDKLADKKMLDNYMDYYESNY